MIKLGNCAHCGEVFAKSVRDICPKCYRKEEEAFKIVYRFLMNRKNREATLQEIVEATNVKEELIIKFIKQKRLRTSQFPKLAYPCEMCGNDIIEGRLCEECSSGIKKEIEFHDKIEEIRKQRNTEETQSVYYSIHKNKKIE